MEVRRKKVVKTHLKVSCDWRMGKRKYSKRFYLVGRRKGKELGISGQIVYVFFKNITTLVKYV